MAEILTDSDKLQRLQQACAWTDEWSVLAMDWLNNVNDQTEPPEPPKTVETIALIGYCRALAAERDKLRREYDEEVDEFNAGFQAYQDSLPDDTPRDDPHDVWFCGYAWAAYEDLKSRIRTLESACEAALKWFTNEPGFPRDSQIVKQLEEAIKHG